jgi:L-amino acid N-acyltransferase YncA
MLPIRFATLADLPAIVAIYNSTVASRQVTADTEEVSVESRIDWFHQHDSTHRPLWVIEEQGQITGWLSYSNFYGRPAYAGTAELSIYLHEQARGKAYGKTLLKFALDYAPKIHVHTVLGFIFAHNLPSVKLFERQGFAQWANLPRVAVLDGIERDLLILGKRLT